MLERLFVSQGITVLTAEDGTAALDVVRGGFHGVILLDFQMPGMDGRAVHARVKELAPRCPVVFLTGHATADLALESIREGALDFVTKPFARERLLESMEYAFQVLRQSEQALGHSEVGGPFAEIVTASESMLTVFRRLAPALTSDIPVLIEGESGTGKELFARAIHVGGQREARPYLALNCAGLPESLLESELFGFERGAFTGADRRRIGRFEAADRGTLFLDEIGEMPLSMQTKLLRVLELGELQRLGSNETLRCDVRIIAATNRPLLEEVEAGRFRKDLYYRLAVLPVRVPPLRDRAGDVARLVEHFVVALARRQGREPPRVAPEAMELLERHVYPGNVRELQNVLAYAVLSCRGSVLGVGALPPTFLAALSAREPGQDGLEPGAAPPAEGFLPLREVERRHVVRALALSGGNRSQAARMLDISRMALYRKLKDHGLE